MAHCKNTDEQGFGAKLAQLRKEAGNTNQELANEIGISRRMVACYEGETERPPTKLLPDLTAALGPTNDALLGVGPRRRPPSPIAGSGDPCSISRE